LARASAFQAEGRGFESRFPLHAFIRSIPLQGKADHSSEIPFHIRLRAHVAQLVEHILGKDEVTGSIPVVGSGYRYMFILDSWKKTWEHHTDDWIVLNGTTTLGYF
jgi:hypothetical protein